MAEPVRGREAMIAAMEPRLDTQCWRFVLLSPDTAPQLLGAAIGTFREDEGMTAIVPSDLAEELGIEGPSFARITLMVHSELEGVGLTAAVSGALADAGIACNMFAAFHPRPRVHALGAKGGRTSSLAGFGQQEKADIIE